MMNRKTYILAGEQQVLLKDLYLHSTICSDTDPSRIILPYDALFSLEPSHTAYIAYKRRSLVVLSRSVLCVRGVCMT